MVRAKNVAIIDIGTNTTKVGLFNIDTRDINVIPRYMGKIELQSAGIKNGYIINKYDTKMVISQAIDKLEKDLDTRIKDVAVILGGVALDAKRVGVVIDLKSDSETGDGLKTIDEDDIERVKVAAEQQFLKSERNVEIIAGEPIMYAYDEERLISEPVGVKARKLGVVMLFIYYKENHLRDIDNIITSLGLNIVDMVPSPIAASKVVLNHKQKMRGVVLLDIGAETVTTSIFRNGSIIGLNVLDIGSYSITNDLSIQLQIGLEEAERLKTDIDSANANIRSKATNIINTGVDNILKKVNTYITKIDKKKKFPAGVVITGGGSLQSGIEDTVRKTLGLPSSRATVSVQNAESSKMRDPYWHSVYGCAIYISEYLHRPRGRILSLPGRGFFSSIFRKFTP